MRLFCSCCSRRRTSHFHPLLMLSFFAERTGKGAGITSLPTYPKQLPVIYLVVGESTIRIGPSPLESPFRMGATADSHRPAVQFTTICTLKCTGVRLAFCLIADSGKGERTFRREPNCIPGTTSDATFLIVGEVVRLHQ
jgi:hypothetical protein